jgi:hypothetical protein
MLTLWAKLVGAFRSALVMRIALSGSIRYDGAAVPAPVIPTPQPIVRRVPDQHAAPCSQMATPTGQFVDRRAQSFPRILRHRIGGEHTQLSGQSLDFADRR